MKVRLDQVLQLDLSDVPESEIKKSMGSIPEFKKPEKWTAPYSSYSYGWWKVFYPEEEE